MAKKLSVNIGYSVAQTLAQTLLMFVLYRFVIDSLGVESLGVWSVILAVSSISKILEIGMGGSVTKYFAECLAKNQKQIAALTLQTAVITVILFFGISLYFIFPATCDLLLYLLPDTPAEIVKELLPLILVSLWISSSANILNCALDASGRSDLRAASLSISSFVFFFLSIVNVERHGLVALAYAHLCQSVVMLITSWLLVRSVSSYLPVVPLKWRFSIFKGLLGYGVNFQVNSLAMLLFEPVTKSLMAYYGGLSVAAYYEMASKLVIQSRAFIVGSNAVIVPVFARMRTENEDIHALYSTNVSFLVFFVTPVFCCLAGFSALISELWIGSYEPIFIGLTVTLTTAWYINSIVAPAYFAYLGIGRLRWVTLSHMAMGLINISMGFFLGSHFGWKGVIVATFLAVVVSSALPFIMYHYEYRIPLRRATSIRELLLIAAQFAIATFLLLLYIYLKELALSLVFRGLVVFITGSITLTFVALLNPIRKDVRSVISNMR